MRGGSNVARGERERENVRFAFALMFRSPGACATRVSPIRGPAIFHRALLYSPVSELTMLSLENIW